MRVLVRSNRDEKLLWSFSLDLFFLDHVFETLSSGDQGYAYCSRGHG